MAGILLRRQGVKASDNGFTLIELLIVVAIIGIIAAIAIPNLLNAVQRDKQKRTMSDIRAVAVAVELYQTDQNSYPEAAASSTVSDVRGFLEPQYTSAVPVSDGWGYPLVYSGSRASYTIISYGRNRQQDLPYTGGATERFWADIVYSDGGFVQWPEGVQSD